MATQYSQSLLEGSIKAALQSIVDPYLGCDLITVKALKHITIQEDLISVALKFNYPISYSHQEHLQHQIESTLSSIPEISPGKDVSVAPKIQTKIAWAVHSHLAQKGVKGLANIKNIIAVASGKGGVGKSTTSANLALAMQAEGASVGILDADIYGPSQPLLLGSVEKPNVVDDKYMVPVMRYGLQSMSMGYLIDEQTPTIWRGPMVSQALQQLLYGTAWDNLDYLIVDLPPGTGDIQLTMAQKIPVSGAIIVTTPQDIALLDAKKALAMFRKLDISVLGIVENMSIHICSNCGHREPIFGSEGGQQMAKQYEVPLLGQLPLDIRIREQTDRGMPTVVAEPEGDIAKLYRELARQVTAKLSLKARDYSAAFPMVV